MIPHTKYVIVCQHISIGSSEVIRRMVRDVPIEDNDSGWQALCDSGKNEDMNKAQVWSIDEILAFDPSVQPILDSPYGCSFSRRDRKDAWEIT
jgi:hypothetical protein